MTHQKVIEQLPPKDRLITRPDEMLTNTQDIKRPGCCPVDPKSEPKKGQAYDNYVKGIDYVA